MVWKIKCPDEDLSVEDNGPIIQSNMDYIKDKLDLDHFFGSNTTEDGRHRFVQMIKSESAGIPTDPTLASNMDGVFYSKKKTAAESPDNEDVQPFFLNNANAMQLLGIRACVVFDISGTTYTIKYKYNVKTVTTYGITGMYTITYENDLPSDNYLVFAGGIRNTAGLEAPIVMAVKGSATVEAVKSKSKVIVETRSTSNDRKDPIQAWVVCFGG